MISQAGGAEHGSFTRIALGTATLKEAGPPGSTAPKPKEVNLFHVFPHGGPHSPARFRKPRLLHPTSLRCDYSFFSSPALRLPSDNSFACSVPARPG